MSQIITKDELAEVAHSRQLKRSRRSALLSSPNTTTVMSGPATASSSATTPTPPVCTCYRGEHSRVAFEARLHESARSRVQKYMVEPRTPFFVALLAGLPEEQPPSSSNPAPPLQHVEEEEQRRRCFNMINWKKGKGKGKEVVPPEDERPETEQERCPGKDDLSKPTNAQLGVWMFPPHGKWAWTQGQQMKESKVLRVLDSQLVYNDVIKSGVIAGKQVVCIARSWKNLMRAHWHGFFTEAAMYKSERYLKNLQGVVVPRIIGLFSSAGEVHLTMEPPHHSFWIQASPSMPDFLKERVINAFRQLHEQKVLHGNPALSNILVGADMRVTLVDFRVARSLYFDNKVKVSEAGPGDLVLELRRVMFMLNYRNRREWEFVKARRYMQIRQHNERRDNLKRRASSGQAVGPIPGRVLIPEEDKLEPPFAEDDLRMWIEAADRPTRVVFPGVTKDKLRKDLGNFMTVLIGMEAHWERMEQQAQCPVHSSRRIVPPESVGDLSTLLGKRSRATFSYDDDSEEPARKRARILNLECTLSDPSFVSSKHICRELHETVMEAACETSPWLSLPAPIHPLKDENGRYIYEKPLHSTYTSTLGKRMWKFRRWDDPFPEAPTKVICKPATREIATTSSSGKPLPPIKVRDYASQPHDGPRGYYVPHPPTQMLQETYRWAYIRGQNLEICRRENLLHSNSPFAASDEVKALSTLKAPSMRNRGTLRRIKEAFDADWARYAGRKAIEKELDDAEGEGDERDLKRKRSTNRKRRVQFKPDFKFVEYDVPEPYYEPRMTEDPDSRSPRLLQRDEDQPGAETESGDPNPRPRKSARLSQASAKQSRTGRSAPEKGCEDSDPKPRKSARLSQASTKQSSKGQPAREEKRKSSLRATPAPKLVSYDRNTWGHVDALVEEKLSPKLGPVNDWVLIKAFRLCYMKDKHRSGLPRNLLEQNPGADERRYWTLPIVVDEVEQLELDRAESAAAEGDPPCAAEPPEASTSTENADGEQDDYEYDFPTFLSVRNLPQDMWRRLRERRRAEELYEEQDGILYGLRELASVDCGEEQPALPTRGGSSKFTGSPVDGNADGEHGSQPTDVERANLHSSYSPASSRKRGRSLDSTLSNVGLGYDSRGKKRPRKESSGGVDVDRASPPPVPRLGNEDGGVEALAYDDEPEPNRTPQSLFRWFSALWRWL